MKGSELQPYLAIINQSSNAIADALAHAKNNEHNDFILHGTPQSLTQEFLIALCAGRYDYLGTMPNKKNWLTNMFKSKKTQYVNDLINKEIDPNTQDSPLHLAVRIAGYHRENAINALQEKNDAQYSESTYKLNQMKKTILFLIETGANVNAENRKGRTPLHLAYQVTEYQSAHILLEAFSNPMAEDNLGKTPFQYLDKSKTKNEAEYQSFRKDYYDAYHATNERIAKNTNDTLSKIKITQSQPIINTDQNKPIHTSLDLSQMRLKNNQSETPSLTSSEITSSSRSNQPSKKPQRRVSSAQIKAIGGKTDNAATWSTIAPTKSKPQSKNGNSASAQKGRKTQETISKVSAYYVKESRSKVYVA